jgi:hypothetical protein
MYDINKIPSLLILMYVFIIPLLIFTCFVDKVYGEAEQDRWGGVIDINLDR